MAKWSAEAVVQSIKERSSKGSPLNFQSVVKEDEKLVGAARRHFGDWDAAMAAAGFKEADYKYRRPSSDEVTTWDRETVAMKTQEYINSGKDMSAHAMQLYDSKLYAAACRYFGSWAELIHQIGLNYQEIRKTNEWNEQDIIAQILNAYRNGAFLSDGNVSALNPSLYKAGINKFGSWEATITAVGLNYEEVKSVRDWSREKIIKLISRAHQNGISYTQLKKAKIIHDSTITHHFSNIFEVYKEAGIDPKAECAENITNRLKEIRKALKLSQEKVAEMMGISIYRFRLIETGVSSPLLVEVLKLTKILNSDVNELFIVVK